MLFASATDSSGVRKLIATSTGPKISSCAIVLAGATSVKSVGGKKQPVVGTGVLGCHIVAPSAVPVAQSARMRASCSAETIAPISTALSSGGPTRSVSIRARSLVISRSCTPSCTSRRDPAQQT